MPAFLEARNLCKSFHGARALEGVDLSVEAGRCLGIIGENGAGKSTLVHILSGSLRADRGAIEVGGAPVQFHSPRDAARAGIGLAHQHDALIARLSIAENLALAAPMPFLTNQREMERRALSLYKQYGLDPGSPSTPCEALSVGARQRVEILKALSQGSRCLLLDEPTAALAPPEVAELLQVIRKLLDSGVAVALVDHKLHEILQICDRVLVLRRGACVADVDARTANPALLVEAMIGRPPAAPARPPAPAGTGPGIFIRNLATRPRPGFTTLNNITFNISPGEILGVGGVDGNGQRELLLALRGLLECAGEPPALSQSDVATIPPDRRQEGLVPDFTIGENLLLDHYLLYKESGVQRFGRAALRARAGAAIAEYDIRTPSPDAPVACLSGGNQQKVVVARALSRSPRLLLAANPTRGLDAGATAAVHRILFEFAARGGSILYFATDLDEIAAVAHRAFVMTRGSMTHIYNIPFSDADLAAIGSAMAGGPAPERHAV